MTEQERNDEQMQLILAEEKAIHGLEEAKDILFVLQDGEYEAQANQIMHRIDQALIMLKAQEPRAKDQKESTALQGFLLDIPSSESILNSVNCHAISLEDASRIIAICASACDAMSPSGFIRWLKERFKQDLVLRGYVE